MDGTLNWRKCKICGKMFDIGTNYEYCSECRKRGKINVIRKRL